MHRMSVCVPRFVQQAFDVKRFATRLHRTDSLLMQLLAEGCQLKLRVLPYLPLT